MVMPAWPPTTGTLTSEPKKNNMSASEKNYRR